MIDSLLLFNEMFLILSSNVAEEVVVDAEDACYSVLPYTIICMFYTSRFI